MSSASEDRFRQSWKVEELSGKPAQAWLVVRRTVATLLAIGLLIFCGLLIYWMFLQVVGGLSSVVSEQGGGVAFWAHIGGFAVGIVFVKVFERSDRVRAHMRQAWRPRDARGW